MVCLEWCVHMHAASRQAPTGACMRCNATHCLLHSPLHTVHLALYAACLLPRRWAYELCIIMAGWLPEPDLHVAVMGVMLQVSGLCYMGPMVRALVCVRMCADVCGCCACMGEVREPLLVRQASITAASPESERPASTSPTPDCTCTSHQPPPAPPPLQGLSSATTVRVGNALGAGLPRSARRTAYTATALTVVLQVTLATVVFLGRDVWGAVVTNIEAVSGRGGQRLGCSGVGGPRNAMQV